MVAQNSVDGFSAQSNDDPKQKKSVLNAKAIVMMIFFIPYLIYFLWCFFLLSVLPNAAGHFDSLVNAGVLISTIGAGLLILSGGLLVLRIVKSNASQYATVISIGKIIAVFLPGIVISVLVAFQIPKEPKLSLFILEPENENNLLAPLSITFSAEQAAEILQRRGLKVIKVLWDYENDGKVNDETVLPKVTAHFDKKGAYIVRASLQLSDNSSRLLYKQLLIPDAIFSVIPFQPIVYEPVTFSVRHLLSDTVKLQEARWDFNGDGEIDEVTIEADTSYTFTRLGNQTISVKIVLSNQTELSMEREISIKEPEPLPFPVKMETQPENLIGPAPFGVLFSIVTNEPVEKINWSLGDSNKDSGDRIGHTFRSKGNYYVIADVYSVSGSVARVSKTVRVVDVLRLSDLTFEGTPQVVGRNMTSEVPATVNISAKTSQPLIDFYWEAPSATSIESSGTILKATYRSAGTYTITLVGTDPSGSVLRLPLTLEVLPPSSLVTIMMTPSDGVAPLSVRFDASETVIPGDEISGFQWRFGDAIAPIHGGAQIEYLFEKPGTYKIGVTALTTSGKTFSAEKTIVVRSPILNACFTASRTEGKAPLGVSFDMSCTTGTPTDIRWDFGDGVTSRESDPIHVFERAGSYTVYLRLQDAQGTSSQEIFTITANP